MGQLTDFSGKPRPARDRAWERRPGGGQASADGGLAQVQVSRIVFPSRAKAAEVAYLLKLSMRFAWPLPSVILT